MLCDCASSFQVRLARPSDYQAWKRVLTVARFPTYMGEEVMKRNARNGGAMFYDVDRQPVGVSLINPRLSIGLVLAVVPAHHNHGMATAILEYLMPNWARVLDAYVEWFEQRGYSRLGTPKKGQKHTTHVMVRSALLGLAGRLAEVWESKSIVSK